jgi:hypothetical protein
VIVRERPQDIVLFAHHIILGMVIVIVVVGAIAAGAYVSGREQGRREERSLCQRERGN